MKTLLLALLLGSLLAGTCAHAMTVTYSFHFWNGGPRTTATYWGPYRDLPTCNIERAKVAAAMPGIDTSSGYPLSECEAAVEKTSIAPPPPMPPVPSETPESAKDKIWRLYPKP